MGNFNNGQPVKLNLKSLTKQEMESLATDFSEGSKKLKQFLLQLWNKGIKTTSCCAGHKDKEKSTPYISIEVSNYDDKELLALLSRVINEKKQNKIEYMFSIKNFTGEGQSTRDLTIYGINYTSLDAVVDLYRDIIFNTSDITNLTNADKKFVNSVMNFYKADYENYEKNVKKKPTHMFKFIQIFSREKEKILMTYHNCKIKSFRENNRRYAAVEGYYKKINNKYYTLKNDEIVELKAKEVKNFKQYRSFTRYSNYHNFSFDFLNSIVNEVNSIAKKEK